MATLNTAARNKLGTGSFAFPKQRKEPLENASHVRNAISRFDQVEGVSDAERDAAWKRIKTAAKKFSVDVGESGWRELGKPAKKASGEKAAAKNVPAKKVSAKKATPTKKAARKTAGSRSTAKKAARKPATKKKSPA